MTEVIKEPEEAKGPEVPKVEEKTFTQTELNAILAKNKTIGS